MINKSCLKFVYEYNFGDTRYHGELCVIINLWLFMIFGAPKEAPGFELILFKVYAYHEVLTRDNLELRICKT